MPIINHGTIIKHETGSKHDTLPLVPVGKSAGKAKRNESPATAGQIQLLS